MANPTIADLSLMNEWARRADLGEFLSSLDSRLKTLEGSSGASDISELQRQVSELEEKVTPLEGLDDKVTELEGKVTPLDGLDEKVSTLEGTVTTNGQKLTTIEGVAEQNKSDISAANGKITALTSRVEALESPGE